VTICTTIGPGGTADKHGKRELLLALKLLKRALGIGADF
jgi:hypothetical protein